MVLDHGYYVGHSLTSILDDLNKVPIKIRAIEISASHIYGLHDSCVTGYSITSGLSSQLARDQLRVGHSCMDIKMGRNFGHIPTGFTGTLLPCKNDVNLIKQQNTLNPSGYRRCIFVIKLGKSMTINRDDGEKVQ
ncbi:hypothetical protein Btru_033754 [Bulinus truncatus]|nr:hypothetical protein Btru_033754 [Bulinus truncatus]